MTRVADWPEGRSTLSLDEIAAMTGFTKRSLLNARKAGRIRCVKWGRGYAMTRPDFEDMIARRLDPEPSEAPTPQMSEAAGVEAIREAMRRRRPRRRAA